MYVTPDTSKETDGGEFPEAHTMVDHHIQMHPVRHCKVVDSCQGLTTFELQLWPPYMMVLVLTFIERLEAG